MLTRLYPPPDETLTLPPISSLTTPYTSTPPLIFSLAYNPHAPAGPSCHASNATLTPLRLLAPAQSYVPLTILRLMECLPDMPQTPLTILTLV
ncbi:hypothetical protein O181_087407 [Austropuccinia psidii MF-1]|uniref:Uncharacterized protein n=1 Tax=Austropuccinia psidii MF-1 TaxID=1389203 RepID=A0A9Q3IPL7_9BASI|nr:hypothetical protein [Austropuccinia psidii MF-1]